MAFAIGALPTGSGVGGDGPIPGFPISDTLGDLGNRAGKFMAKHGRRRDHAGMVATTVNLQVGTASEGGSDSDTHFARLEGWRIHFLDPDILLTMKDGGFHLLALPCEVSGFGPAIRSRISTKPTPASMSSTA